MAHIPKDGESSQSARAQASPSSPSTHVLSRVDQQAKQFEGTHSKPRRGLSILEKYQICKKRVEMKENEAMKLDEFARYFPSIAQAWPHSSCSLCLIAIVDPITGKPIPKSTSSNILLQSDHCQWLRIDVSAPDNWKKKARKEQFPILEKHIVEWVYRAQLARVITTDEIILGVAQRFTKEYVSIGTVAEDYSCFEFSGGWLMALKNRHGLRRVQTQGDTIVHDPVSFGIPAMREEIREQLKDFAPQDTYNCDELALQ